MLKTLAAATVMALVSTSAFAAMECSKAEMDKMSTQMKTMTDKTKQDMAMKEMKMAGDMMDKKDMTACSMHMENASKAMDMKK